MKKHFIVAALFLFASIENYAMKKEISDCAIDFNCINEISIVDHLNTELLDALAQFLDYQSFVAFSLSCTTIQDICNQLPMRLLPEISVHNVTENNNTNLVKKYFKHTAASNSFQTQNGIGIRWSAEIGTSKIVGVVFPNPVEEELYKQILLLIIEHGSDYILKCTLDNADYSVFQDDDFLKNFLEKAHTVSRGEEGRVILYNLLFEGILSPVKLLDLIELVPEQNEQASEILQESDEYSEQSMEISDDI